MGFLDGFLGSIFGSGGSGSSGGGLFSSFMNMALEPIQAGMDSLGISQHGRDQYFARDLQRELLWDQINAQIAENQKNRDFSKEFFNMQWDKMLQNYPELLKMNSDAQFNLWRNQFAEQKQYNEEVNSPAAQVQRMMAAGLNPVQGVQTQVQSNMGGNNVGAPPMISGSPLGGSVSPIGLPQGLSGAGREIAGVGSFLRDLANAKESGAKAIGQEIENKFLDSTLDERIRGVALQNKWTEEQTSLVEQQFSEITARLNLMQKEGQLKDKQIKWFDSEMSAKIDELKASKEYQESMSKYNDKQRELLEDMFDDLKTYQSYNTQQMGKFVDLLEKYGDAQAIIGMLSQVVGSAVDVIGLFNPSKKVVDIFHHK